ncbi:MAG: nucleotidyltransferase domain-containing protein [Spirochaetales bacterium]|nr:nucleotidyltransferase domain-containing protein [Spirochaetales bacterium]
MLNERAKELNCLYKIDEIIKDNFLKVEDKLQAIIKRMPQGWQYPSRYSIRIEYMGNIYLSEEFQESPWVQFSPISVDEDILGKIEVFCENTDEIGSNNPFLVEEQNLLDSIAEKISLYLSKEKLKVTIESLSQVKALLAGQSDKKWEVILELLKQIDLPLYKKVSRKMLNHLCWIGVAEARNILQCIGMKKSCSLLHTSTEMNTPMEKRSIDSIGQLGTLVFPIAAKVLNNDELVFLISKWVADEKVHFLTRTLEMSESSLGDISDAVYKYYHMEDKGDISPASTMNLRALLIRRVFTEQTDFIALARDYVDIEDFYPVLQQTIYSHNCHGKLGGKSTGLFVAAQIVRRFLKSSDAEFPVKTPKTWHVASGVMVHFIFLNNLEEIMEQRYKPIEEIREEYPNIIQIFKNSNFPPGVIKSLNIALDEFEDSPIIVRSSSLLEDRLGAVFSGKYKSLFLANQGSKKERLTALMDAIAEVYASIFGPDPIEYRRDKGLLDFKEEMAIMIQEVVGTRIGPYFMPAFAGVAFSHNEFRWSPRIEREDSLVRMVPGLGTRAVDRLSDDYPRLLSPGKPDLNVNVSSAEVRKYSPREVDLINLETNSFESLPLTEILAQYGDDYPEVEKIVSAFHDDNLFQRSRMKLDFEKDELITTFDGLIKRTTFTSRIKELLDVLKEHMNTPVDIEFASTGKDLYLLQCRPQFDPSLLKPALIPQDVPEDDILFTAEKHISNGSVPDLTHIVYVDPLKYGDLENLDDLKMVGKVIGNLNQILPHRQFLLIGPGRWGSRGDIKLGVSVTYSDISNTALLVEVARKKGSYVPDLSFGTHFFQDLVEASIHYLPLYPDEANTIFNTWFFQRSKNILSTLLPQYSHLEDVVSVIDVPAEAAGKVLKVVMNGELEKAMAYLTSDSGTDTRSQELISRDDEGEKTYWPWRQRMAEHIASKMDFTELGTKAVYIFGSTKNGTAGMGSDIDLLIHFTGTDEQRKSLLLWLDGWSRCLAEINYLRTGYKCDGLLDIHLVTDEDIRKKTSFAIKIGAISDAAELIRAES